MPRFYFNHLAQNGARQIDPQGLTLPSLHQALDEATFAARCAAALANEPMAGCYEIENEQHAVIARVPYYIDPDADSEAA
jgi:hypothetical protein